jgi:uncharacterized Fe-S cluster protein YjdI/CDGSH-type Zn-finger protein
MVTRTYESGDLTVYWDAERCIHTGVCLRALPAVFDVKARPWVSLDNADADAVVTAVRKCPTGALRYERGGVPEPAPDETTMIALRGGPLLARGRLRVIEGATGTVVAEETRLALCRCGNSRNQPFCDNSHRRVGFDEAAPSKTTRSDAQSPADICPPQDFVVE